MNASRQSVFVSGAAVIAAALLMASTFFPLWWVSLTAPNYPKDTFPDGIRIQFSFSGVSNGCTTMPKTSLHAQEIQQEDMGWRNPDGTYANEGGQAKGGEKSLEKTGAIDCMSEMNTINHYVGMHPIGVGAPVERLMSPFIIAILVAMLLGFAIPHVKVRAAVLSVAFIGIAAWLFSALYTGGLETFVTEYKTDAGKYFRDTERIAQWGNALTHWVWVITAFLIVTMVVSIVGTLKWPRFQLALALVPAGMPVFFIGAFAAWLYFFGHNLHPWGAFTVKPFMPTVFGEGKVAQFSTFSYPTPMFGLLAGSAVLALLAFFRRRLELMPDETPSVATVGQPSPKAG